jgi:hypothetical protein
MKKIQFLILLIAILIIVLTGIAPSIKNDDWSWLSRSGSLLTAYGVTLAYLDISGMMGILVSKFNIAMRKVLVEDANTISTDQAESLENVFKDVVIDIVKDIRFIEFASIFCGTIIWGYGDKFTYIFS